MNNPKFFYPMTKRHIHGLLKIIEGEYSSLDKEKHKKLINKHNISPTICVDINDTRKGPYTNLEKKQIYFPEKFTTYLWITTFFLTTWMHEYYIPLMNSKFSNSYFSRDPNDLCKRSFELLSWGDNLKKTGTNQPPQPWPDEIIKFDISERMQDKSTAIWQRALAFIFFHELGHICLEHTPTNDSNLSKTHEIEADNFAYDICLSPRKENLALTNYYGILVGMINNFYFSETPQNLTSQKHPDVDTRVNMFHERIDPHVQDNDHKIFLKTFSRISIINWVRLKLDANTETSKMKENEIDKWIDDTISFIKKPYV